MNVAREAQPTTLKFNGAGLGSGATALVLTSERPQDENSLDEPTKVAPVKQRLESNGSVLQHTFPPNSVTVLRVPLQ